MPLETLNFRTVSLVQAGVAWRQMPIEAPLVEATAVWHAGEVVRDVFRGSAGDAS